MKYADYIQQVEIDGLWNGRKHILWTLDRSVNILSGVNGVGKTTILKKVTGVLSEKKLPGVKLDFFPDDATGIRYAVIQKFTVEPDELLEDLEQKYIALPEEKKGAFYDIVDNLFSATDKVILRSEKGIRLMQEGEILTFHQLSSGEKQMLLILLTVLLQNSLPYVLFMDEPEVSLHFEWQKRLITLVRELNPNVQVILTTHSPAVVMDGWQDCVTDVEDIILKGS